MNLERSRPDRGHDQGRRVVDGYDLIVVASGCRRGSGKKAASRRRLLLHRPESLRQMGFDLG